ncbi:hypothetical protein [Brevibacillus laterosporus]|uniref:hypothetical protein n=1 Tax=Brevibacillus laterosporus TaxID=1465 RepID=UPI000839C71D|nr:hypothetical protein [Brevibacillus laterosporus]
MKELAIDKIPAVFYFQPLGFHIMETKEEILKWEEQIKNDVGLKNFREFEGAGSCTACTCGDGGADDCDQD